MPVFEDLYLAAGITPNEVSPPGADHIDQTICRFLEEQGVPGATLAVAKDGRIVYEQGYGVAGAGRRMRARHVLRVASISKPITAIAILRLCQDGKLSLDTPVFGLKGVLKGLKARGDKRLRRVTVRHLLQHSAGWDRDAVGDAVFWSGVPCPQGLRVTSREYNRHLLQYVLNRKLQFTPGSRSAYSNLGYLVVGEVIEAVSGQRYKEHVQALLTTYGVTDMRIGKEERVDWQSKEAEYFNIRGPSHSPSVLPGQTDSQVLPQYGSFPMRNTGAYGGWVGRARDLLKVILSLEASQQQTQTSRDDLRHSLDPHTTQKVRQSARLLDEVSVRAMLARPAFEEGHEWYGLGLDVQNDGKTWGHTGAMEGTCATVQRHHSGVAWCFLLNAWARDPDLDGVVKLALSRHPHLSPYPPGLASCSSEGLRVCTRDGAQIIMTHVPPVSAAAHVREMQEQGLSLTWVGVNELDQDGGERVTFHLTFSKEAGLTCRLWVLDVETSELQEVVALCVQERGLQPDLLATYVSGGRLLALVLLVRAAATEERREVVSAVRAEEYVRLLARRRKCGYEVVSQCVTDVKGDLLVSAIMARTLPSSSPDGGTPDATCRDALCRGTCQKFYVNGSSSSSSSSSSAAAAAAAALPSRTLQCSALSMTCEENPVISSDSVALPSPPLAATVPSAVATPPAAHQRSPPLKTLAWVQMTPDNFLAELGRQAKRHCGLRHAHFYTSRGQSFVSGTWSPACPRDVYQRMGVTYRGLLPALAEAGAANIRLRLLGQYVEDEMVCYAVVWEAPTTEQRQLSR